MICIPITGTTMQRALREIEEGIHHADILELRMDLIEDSDLPTLVGAVRSIAPTVKTLVTPARAEQSPQARHLESRVEEMLAMAVELAVDYVDIELRDENIKREELLALIRDRGDRTKLIVSYHDFHGTPSLQALQSLFHECVQAGAHITKIVAWAHCPEDNLTVLGLIPYVRQRGREIIAFCMGPAGRMSRVMAPLLGSAMSFAALRQGSESAPGQLTVTEMRRILGMMGHGR